MCGICGKINLKGEPIDRGLIGQMCSVLSHRGPDDEGIYLDGYIGLGHRRLSIIDLAGGHQPLSNEDGMIWIVYNGEIYNFPELKAQLLSRGHQFTTLSDTEVIVHAYEEYGFSCVSKFNGMFAFAIWDERKKTLFLARDRLGIKPLYYYLDSEKFLFASEIKSILVDSSVPRKIDYKGLNNFFTFCHAVAPDTIYSGIKKLLPGHFLIYQDGKARIEEYWDVLSTDYGNGLNGLTDDSPKHKPNPLNPFKKSADSEEEYAEEVYRLLQTSVRRQLISDVPLGVFLSGGIDSSAIVGLMSQVASHPVNTFSVGFEIGGAYNELADAAIVAKRFETEHHELVVKEANLVELLNKLVYHYDEPFGDAACFPTYLVSEFARQSVKVALSGEGGDELFGGYRRYSAERFSKYYQKLPIFLRDGFIRKLANSIPRSRRLKKAIASMSVKEPEVRYASWLVVFSDEMKRELFSAEINEFTKALDSFEVYRKYYYKKDGDLIDRLLYTDEKTWLVDTYLEKTDKASMAVGLEVRVPFLDHELVEFAATIPSKYKIKGFTKKYILKKAMRGLLPESVIKKPKHGFSVPTDPWFRGKLKDYVFEVLFDNKARGRGYFNYPYIEKLYREHLDGKEVYDFHLWLLLNFELWHRKFMD